MSNIIRVIHGPSLNLLGEREPEVYGTTTLASIDAALGRLADRLGLALATSQHSGEGDIIDAILAARHTAAGLILNAGAYTHTSYAIRDAIAASRLPTLEVHLSNIQAREPHRRRSVLAPVCVGQISGLGPDGYLLALLALARRLGLAADLGID